VSMAEFHDFSSPLLATGYGGKLPIGKPIAR
jgi:hypothetical protein